MARRVGRRAFLRTIGSGIGAATVGSALMKHSSRVAHAAQSGTLTYGMASSPDTLDVTVTTSSFTGRIGLHLSDPLVWQPSAGQFAPGLATSWSVAPDAKTYTFKLRENVKFHDGTPLTAEAVKTTFDRIVNPNTKSQLAFDFIGPYDHAEVLNPTTVRVHFKAPYAAFLDAVSTPYLGILSPTALQKYGKDFGSVVFVSTGPFILQSYRPDAEVVLIRNPNYAWASPIFKHQGPSALERLVFRIIPEEAVRMATLSTGETQFIENVPTRDYARLKTDRNVVLVEIPQAGTGYSLMMNEQRAPTTEPAVRRAIQVGLDRAGFIKAVWDGVGTAGCGPITPNIYGFDPATCKMYTYNPDLARRILDEAGWQPGPDGIRQKGGQRLTLEFYFHTRFPRSAEMATFIQANLKTIGMDAVLHNLAPGAYFAAVRTGQQNLNFWWETATDAGLLLDEIFASRHANGGTNRNYYKNAQTDRLIEQIQSEPDRSKRKTLIDQVQRKVIDEAVMAYLTDPVSLYAYRRGITGVWVDWGGNYPYFYDVRLPAR
jgi:peptide/nickel transport system substrate-binding protein